jgi:protein phosphatase
MRLLGGTGSHVGNVREANQDRVYFGGRLAALADGMGGHQGGERAAELAIGQFRAAWAELSENDLVDVVLAANRAVHGHAAENGLPGMGTTVVALTLHGDGTMTVANVGDSRAYWIRGDYMTQVTEDHSFVEDLVRQGRLTPEEAAIHPQRNILTRAVGIGVEVEVDRFPIEEPAVGDRFLLCSDGLFNELPEDEILDIILEAADPATAARQLIEATLQTPCRDNVTVAVVEVVDDDDPRLEDVEEGHVDDGVITSEYLDDDNNAITAQVPIVSAALLVEDGPPSALDGDGDDPGPNGNGNGAGGGGEVVSGLDRSNGHRPAATASAVALADDDPEPGIVVEDPEASRDTAEMDVVVDGPLEPQPRSRLVLAFGSLLLVAGLVVGGYFLARAYATAGFFIAEDPSTATLAIFEGRQDGLFGLFEPEVIDGTQTDHPAEALAELDMDDVLDRHYDDRARAEDKLMEIDDRLTRAAREAEAAQAAAVDAATPSDGTSDSEVTGSESTQLGEQRGPSDGEAGTGDGGSTTEGG